MHVKAVFNNIPGQNPVRVIKGEGFVSLVSRKRDNLTIKTTGGEVSLLNDEYFLAVYRL